MTLAQRPASILDTDYDAHTSVSEDAGTVPFTVLRLTSVHRTKNTLRQWSGTAKSPRVYNVLATDMDDDVLILLRCCAVVSIKRFLSSLGPCSPLTELAKRRENHAQTQ